MRRLTWALLPLLALLNGCPQRKTATAVPAASPDYESVRQRSEQSHQSLDQQQVPSQTP
ncbi:MAG: hypothetical protein NTY77_18005 [Elusimicrobia bacterium]|nr:hypothetical protein [Elusimicrobiota bacterium]